MEGLTSTKCLHSQTFCCQVFAPYYHQSTLHRGVRSLRASRILCSLGQFGFSPVYSQSPVSGPQAQRTLAPTGPAVPACRDALGAGSLRDNQLWETGQGGDMPGHCGRSSGGIGTAGFPTRELGQGTEVTFLGRSPC